MDDIYTTKTDYKKTLRHKGKGRAPNLYTYRYKNKDRNHTINSREMLQTSDISSPILTIKSAGLAWARQTFLKVQLGSDIDIRFNFFDSGAITCFVYPSANRTLLLQERTGHLRAQPVETHVYPNCFSSSLFFLF